MSCTFLRLGQGRQDSMRGTTIRRCVDSDQGRRSWRRRHWSLTRYAMTKSYRNPARRRHCHRRDIQRCAARESLRIPAARPVAAVALETDVGLCGRPFRLGSAHARAYSAALSAAQSTRLRNRRGSRGTRPTVRPPEKRSSGERRRYPYAQSADPVQTAFG